jgi:cyclase
MLRKRLIGTILVKDNVAVQSYGFRRYTPIGSPVICAEYLDAWGADEIALLDISASKNRSGPNLEMISKVAAKSRVPLMVGGGISTMKEVHDTVEAGADKIAMNTAFILQPELLREASENYGAQCIIASLDAIRTSDGYSLYRDDEGRDIVTAAKLAEELGAGEILLNSVDQDGSLEGYALDLISKVNRAVNVPLIALGGAGAPLHFEEILNEPNVAAAAGNYFQHFEHSIAVLKHHLGTKGFPIRQKSGLEYMNVSHTLDGRLKRTPEQLLLTQMYEPLHQ